MRCARQEQWVKGNPEIGNVQIGQKNGGSLKH